MHYLYDRPEASFEDLLLAAMWAEVESRDHHLTKVKAVTLIEPDGENKVSGIGLNDLNEQLKSLGQYLKSATFTAKPSFQSLAKIPGISPKDRVPRLQDLFGITHQYNVINVTAGDIIRGRVPTERMIGKTHKGRR